MAVTIVLTLIPLYLLSYHYRMHHPYGGGGSNTSTNNDKLLSPRETFIQTWLSTHLITPFDEAPLSAYCNLTTWRPNLVFHLADANGGIGNLRGNFLDFIFTAIEHGASILLPTAAKRDSGDLSNVWGGSGHELGFDEMFDEEWFVGVLGRVCPLMRVYKFEEGMEMVRPVEGLWRSRSRRLDEDEGNTRAAGLESLEEWLNGNEDFRKRYGGGRGKSGGGDEEEAEPILINVERTLWDIDTRSLPMRGSLRRNFGQILQISPIYRNLAALITWNLIQRFNLTLPANNNPHEPLFSPQRKRTAFNFYGAHLRIASDAQHAGWLTENLTSTAQMDAYISHAHSANLQIIYVASGGSPSDLLHFKHKAASHNPPLIVVSKSDLLPAAELAMVEKDFSWDQQALIDWEVLSKCSVLGGIVKSSFALNLAMSRHQILEDQGRVGEPWRVGVEREDVAFDDGWSRIWGRDEWHEKRVPRGMWP